MRKLKLAMAAGAVGVLALVVAAGGSQAGADRISFPTEFQTKFALYSQFDQFAFKFVEFFYVDRPSLKAARPGKPLPYGTTLVMAIKKAKLGPDGQPVLDKSGRMIPEGDFVRLQIQKKGKGWGDDHPANMRNGDWEYANFNLDGSRIADQKYDSCFTCHLNRQKPDEDFTFLFAPYLRDHKGG